MLGVAKYATSATLEAPSDSDLLTLNSLPENQIPSQIRAVPT